jgi:hypothetical protein
VSADLEVSLRHAGLLHSPHPVLVPLTGGVSSEIYRVEDGARRFVVKRALAKLRVDEDWHADPMQGGGKRLKQPHHNCPPGK